MGTFSLFGFNHKRSEKLLVSLLFDWFRFIRTEDVHERRDKHGVEIYLRDGVTHDFFEESGELIISNFSFSFKIDSPEDHFSGESDYFTTFDECQCCKVESVVLIFFLVGKLFDSGPDIIQIIFVSYICTFQDLQLHRIAV